MNRPVVLTLLTLLSACGGEDPAVDTAVPGPSCTGDTGAPAPDWDTWARPFFTTWCQPCHASGAPQRYGAPESASFDTEEEARNQAAAIRATVLDGGSMPVGGGLSTEDRTQLAAWLCTVEASP